MQDTNHELSNTESTALVLLNTRNIGGYKSLKDMIKPNAEMPWGNHFAFLHISVPNLTKTEFSNPLDFVLKVHRLIKKKRNSVIVCLTARLLESLRKFKGPESLSVTMVRYVGKLRVSVGVEKDFIHPCKFKSSIENAFQMIFKAAVQSPSSANSVQ
ncbi:hypothetical protein F0562_010781 [Nyssa sinensis]|uniref:O-acyltransferase WSD1 C-terminal domain-containing protein n=1 Tax=Nyssa sinensis TaxID=561372 RepID=A0A5J5A2Y1_9ASTE|nr:hypothetical protein F0562_010781 [Nyssa sinensis]